MATKKQKRLAGIARQQEQDALHQAQIEERTRVAAARERRRKRREMEQTRKEQNLKAARALRAAMSR